MTTLPLYNSLRYNSLHVPKTPAETRVVVAMSGGVDSSVVAALLKDEGYDVIGITLQLYDHGEAVARKGACCAGQDIHDARTVAETLGIPHYVLNYESRFSTAVMDSFVNSYLAGETPVPCVTCNQKIKFKDLFTMAKDLGADALATGHYIQSRPKTASHETEAGEQAWELLRAVDPDRDQSYFLFATTPEQLAFLRFPLGGLHKSETRALAEKFGLKVAQKSDSQDICFVPTGHYSQVIERLRPGAADPGNIVHIDGRILGRHDGIIHYTVGQRRGIGIAAEEALYVIKLNADQREVIVGPREALKSHWLVLRELNWLGDEDFNLIPDEGLPLFARVRSTQAPQAATLFNRNNVPVVKLRDGQDGVSPGQACVFYDSGDGISRILGGGWITSAENSEGFFAGEKPHHGGLEKARHELGAVSELGRASELGTVSL